MRRGLKSLFAVSGRNYLGGLKSIVILVGGGFAWLGTMEVLD